MLKPAHANAPDDGALFFLFLHPSACSFPSMLLSPDHRAPTQTPNFLMSYFSSITCVMISAPPMRQWGMINVAISIILRNNSSLGEQAQPSRSDWGTGGALPLSDGPNCDTLLTRPCHQLQPQAPGRSSELFLPLVT